MPRRASARCRAVSRMLRPVGISSAHSALWSRARTRLFLLARFSAGLTGESGRHVYVNRALRVARFGAPPLRFRAEQPRISLSEFSRWNGQYSLPRRSARGSPAGEHFVSDPAHGRLAATKIPAFLAPRKGSVASSSSGLAQRSAAQSAQCQPFRSGAEHVSAELERLKLLLRRQVLR